MTFSDLVKASYVSLRSYKKDSSAVDLPVWVVGDEKELFIYTFKSSYKIKRLRNNPHCQLAVCNISGKRIRSPWVNGIATITEDADTTAHVLRLLSKKYGLFGWFPRIKVALMPGYKGKTAIIRITPQ